MWLTLNRVCVSAHYDDEVITSCEKQERQGLSYAELIGPRVELWECYVTRKHWLAQTEAQVGRSTQKAVPRSPWVDAGNPARPINTRLLPVLLNIKYWFLHHGAH